MSISVVSKMEDETSMTNSLLTFWPCTPKYTTWEGEGSHVMVIIQDYKVSEIRIYVVWSAVSVCSMACDQGSGMA